MLHAKPAAQSGQRIAGGKLFSLVQLGLIVRDLNTKLIDGGFAFGGHAINRTFELGGAPHNRGANHGQVVEPGNLVQPGGHLVELSRTALVPLPDRFRRARQNQKQLLHLSGPLQVVFGRALAPILQLLLNAFVRPLQHFTRKVARQSIIQLLQTALQPLAQRWAGLHAVPARLQQRRAIGGNGHRQQFSSVGRNQHL